MQRNVYFDKSIEILLVAVFLRRMSKVKNTQIIFFSSSAGAASLSVRNINGNIMLAFDWNLELLFIFSLNARISLAEEFDDIKKIRMSDLNGDYYDGDSHNVNSE